MTTTIASLPAHRRADLTNALQQADNKLNSACCAIHRDGTPPAGSETGDLLWKIRELQTAICEIEEKVKNG